MVMLGHVHADIGWKTPSVMFIICIHAVLAILYLFYTTLTNYSTILLKFSFFMLNIVHLGTGHKLSRRSGWSKKGVGHKFLCKDKWEFTIDLFKVALKKRAGFRKKTLMAFYICTSSCSAIINNRSLINITYVGVKTVWHQLKFTIRRDVWNGTIILKAWQTNTLVKLDIFKFNWFTLST